MELTVIFRNQEQVADDLVNCTNSNSCKQNIQVIFTSP